MLAHTSGLKSEICCDRTISRKGCPCRKLIIALLMNDPLSGITKFHLKKRFLTFLALFSFLDILKWACISSPGSLFHSDDVSVKIYTTKVQQNYGS